MKTLQERMNDMKPYFRGIEMYNEALMVKVVYPNNWRAYPSDDGRIKVTPSDDKSSNVTYYYADSKDTTYEEMFDLVEQTIKANQDIVLKLKLLKDKVEELKELFQNTPYDDLLNLQFVIEKPTKPKRKYVRKKVKVEEEVKQEEAVVDAEELYPEKIKENETSVE
jgi:hypothetical protein